MSDHFVVIIWIFICLKKCLFIVKRLFINVRDLKEGKYS